MRRNIDRFRHAGNEVDAFDLQENLLVLVIRRMNAADFDFDFFRRTRSDDKVVDPFQMLADRGVHLVAADTHAFLFNNAGKGDYGDFRGSAADIDDHASSRFRDGKPDSDCGRHRLLDKEDVSGAGALRAVLDGAGFHFGDSGGNRDQNAGTDKAAARRQNHFRLFDEVAQHDPGRLIVRNDAVFHRAQSGDVVRSSSEHLLRFVADSERFMRLFADCDNRWLGKYDASVLQVDQTVGSSKVDSNIA